MALWWELCIRPFGLRPFAQIFVLAMSPTSNLHGRLIEHADPTGWIVCIGVIEPADPEERVRHAFWRKDTLGTLGRGATLDCRDGVIESIPPLLILRFSLCAMYTEYMLFDAFERIGDPKQCPKS